MKPAAFSYHRPGTLAEVLALLSQHGDEAKVLAGGQSLGPMLNMRLAQPAQLVDLNHVAELTGIRDCGQAVEIGALTRHSMVEADPLVRRHLPLLAEAAATIGHYAIRQRGTLGGSLAHADPAAQMPLVAVALGAEIMAVGPRGSRSIPVQDFLLGIMTTALEPDEIIAAVRLAKAPSGEGWAYEHFTRRRGDFAIVSVAATVALDGDRVAAARIAIGGVEAAPVRIDTTALRGLAVDQAPALAVEAAQAVLDPADDARVPVEYRRELIDVLIRRALGRAIARASGA